MVMINDGGKKRVVMAGDFQDVTITFTPNEWQELLDLFEFRKKTCPSVFAKATKSIHQKLVDSRPQLKPGLKYINNEGDLL